MAESLPIIMVNYFKTGKMKSYIIFLLFFFSFGSCFTQDLKKAPLSKQDSIDNVIMRYEYLAKDESGGIILLLRKDHTYRYDLGTHLYQTMSEGIWWKSNNAILLKSFIQKDDIPVSIKYGNDGTFADSFKVSIVKNIKGDFLPAFVFINNDSVKCDPSLGFCDNEYTEIKRIKVVLENGLSSKWINIENSDEKIIITVMTEQPLLRYTVMCDEKYTIKGDLLKK